jgi:hypothetical protein
MRCGHFITHAARCLGKQQTQRLSGVVWCCRSDGAWLSSPDREAGNQHRQDTRENLTFAEIPDVVIDLIDRQTEPPWGAGEPTCAVVASAIGSAIFEATGVRPRSVPFTPAKVKAALGA